MNLDFPAIWHVFILLQGLTPTSLEPVSAKDQPMKSFFILSNGESNKGDQGKLKHCTGSHWNEYFNGWSWFNLMAQSPVTGLMPFHYCFQITDIWNYILFHTGWASSPHFSLRKVCSCLAVGIFPDCLPCLFGFCLELTYLCLHLLWTISFVGNSYSLHTVV